MWWILYACWYYHYFALVSYFLQDTVSVYFFRIFFSGRHKSGEAKNEYIFVICFCLAQRENFKDKRRIFFSWSIQWRNWCVSEDATRVCRSICLFNLHLYTIFLSMLINLRIFYSVWYSKQHTNDSLQQQQQKKTAKISSKRSETKKKTNRKVS